MKPQQLLPIVGLALLLVLAGCTADFTHQEPPNQPPSPQPINNSTLTADIAESQTVTVKRVIDGDTMEIEYQNGTEDTIRLLGVDTPETTLSRTSPNEYPSINNSTAGRDHLYNWSERATELATHELENEKVKIATDADSDRRGYYGRLLVYVYVDKKNFNKYLIETGHARVYDSQFSLQNEFKEKEEHAQVHNVGLWLFNETHTKTKPT